MKTNIKEGALPCKLCFWFKPSERKLIPFANGETLWLTGRCGNPRSILFQQMVAGGVSATRNGVVQGLIPIAKTLECFTPQPK